MELDLCTNKSFMYEFQGHQSAPTAVLRPVEYLGLCQAVGILEDKTQLHKTVCSPGKGEAGKEFYSIAVGIARH